MPNPQIIEHCRASGTLFSPAIGSIGFDVDFDFDVGSEERGAEFHKIVASHAKISPFGRSGSMKSGAWRFAGASLATWYLQSPRALLVVP